MHLVLQIKWWSCPFSKDKIKHIRICVHIFYLIWVCRIWRSSAKEDMEFGSCPGVRFWLSPFCGSVSQSSHLSMKKGGQPWEKMTPRTVESRAGRGYLAGFLSFSAFKFNLIYKFFYRKQKSERKLCRTDLLDYRDFQRSRFFFSPTWADEKHTHRLKEV